jgi:hypothetical protein
MSAFPIAVVDMDLVIGVVAVIVWLVVQAAGRKSKGGPPPPAEPGEPMSPGDELRKFFENMEREAAGDAEESKPAPPPAPIPPRRAGSRPAVRVQVQRRPEEVIEQPVPVPPSAPQPHSLVVAPPVELMRHHVPAHKWAKGYACPENLRKMMVAREVLGPPLALRPAAHRYGMSA